MFMACKHGPPDVGGGNPHSGRGVPVTRMLGKSVTPEDDPIFMPPSQTVSVPGESRKVDTYHSFVLLSNWARCPPTARHASCASHQESGVSIAR